MTPVAVTTPDVTPVTEYASPGTPPPKSTSPFATAYALVGALLFGSLAGLELLARVVPEAASPGIFLWFGSYLYVLSFAAYCLTNLVQHAWQHKTPVTLLTLAIATFVVAWHWRDPRALSGEATQEIACVLSQLTTTADHGYRESCFLGYPTRQLYLPAVPTLLFGRSMAALYAGASLYLLLGLVVFTSGIVRYFRYSAIGGWMNAILVGAIFHFYYFNSLTFQYEQSAFPFGLALLAVGLFFHYRATPKPYLLVLLGYSGLYLVYAYTPSLALLGLELVTLLYWAACDERSLWGRLPLVGLVLGLLLFLVTSFSLRGDLRLHDSSGETGKQLMSDLATAFEHLLYQNHGNPMVSPLFSFVFVALVLACALGVFGKRAVPVALWIIATIIAAEVAQGYAYYGIDYRLERATVAVPVFLGLLTAVCARWVRRANAWQLCVAALIIGSSGLYYHNLYMRSLFPNPNWAFIQWLESNVPAQPASTQPRSLYILYGADQYNNLASLYDALQYFMPGVTTTIDPALDQRIAAAPAKVLSTMSGIFVLAPNGKANVASQALAHDPQRYRYDGRFRTDRGAFLLVFNTR